MPKARKADEHDSFYCSENSLFERRVGRRIDEPEESTVSLLQRVTAHASRQQVLRLT